jgi:hypothetical protein
LDRVRSNFGGLVDEDGWREAFTVEDAKYAMGILAAVGWGFFNSYSLRSFVGTVGSPLMHFYDGANYLLSGCWISQDSQVFLKC